MAILTDLRDPRVEGRDRDVCRGVARHAAGQGPRLGDGRRKQSRSLCLHGLESSAGFLQAKIAKRIDTRYTPKLRFELDVGVKKSLAIARLLHDVLPGDDVDLVDEEPPPATTFAEDTNSP